MIKYIIDFSLLFSLFSFLILTSCQSITKPPDEPSPTPLPPLQVSEIEHSVGLIIGLQIAPNGDLFYAAQDGTIKRKVDSTQGESILEIPVSRVGFEDGLLGFVFSPDFPSTGHFFTYHTAPDPDGNPLRGEINRWTWNGNNGRVSPPTLIFELPTSPEQQYHFGGGLRFGPDGRLYLIFGDTNQPFLARSADDLAGSILRLNPDGSIPKDNPFGPESAVYATGFRNGFGLAWHPQTGALYQAENGDSCDDELNLIKGGADYGWGRYEYNTCPYPDDRGEAPVFQWERPIGPSAAIFYTADQLSEFRDKLLLCGSNHNHIWIIDPTRPQEMTNLQIGDRDWFCQAALTQAPDGSLYSATAGKIWKISRQ